MPKHTAAKRATKKQGTTEGGVAPGSRPKAQKRKKPKSTPRKK